MWSIVGAINKLFYYSEKNKGAFKPHPILNTFKNTLDACDPCILAFLSQKFTWWNRQDSDGMGEETPIRYCVGSEWIFLFLNAKLTHIDDDFLDLSSTFTMISLTTTNMKKLRCKPSENYWVVYHRCEEVVY